MIWTISMLKTIIQQNGMLDILLIYLRQCGITLANEHSISSAKCQKLTVSYAMQDGWIPVSPIIIKTCIKMFQIHSIHQFINLFNGSLFFPKREMTSYKKEMSKQYIIRKSMAINMECHMEYHPTHM